MPIPPPMAASSSKIGFHRPWHRLVWQVLESLNSDLLSSAKCYFSGGTGIARALGEFRESVDVGFLCSCISPFPRSPACANLAPAGGHAVCPYPGPNEPSRFSPCILAGETTGEIQMLECLR